MQAGFEPRLTPNLWHSRHLTLVLFEKFYCAEIQNRSEYMNGSDKQAQTPVLLVCVYNQRGITLTHDIYYRLFSTVGTINKILIFDKAKIWKAFIEFSRTEEANVAISKFDGEPLLDDGSRMSIFSSKLRTVHLQQEQSGGVDYNQLQIEEVRVRAQTTSNYPEKEEVRPRRLTEEQSPRLPPQKKSLSNQFISTTLGLVDEQFRQMSLQHSLKEDFEEDQKDASEQFYEEEPSSAISFKDYVPAKFLQENKQSKVLFIRSINRNFIDEPVLYQIFRGFGRVCTLVIIQGKSSVLVEYQHIEDSVQAKEHINSVKQFGKTFYSNFATLLQRKEKKTDLIYRYDGSQPRRKSYNLISQFLHFCNLNQRFQSQFIKRVQQQSGVQVVEVRFLQDRKGLLKFSSALDSMLVLGRCQGMLMKNTRIKFSFTRSKF